MRSLDAGSSNDNARAIVNVCQRELAGSGFDNRKGTTLWRRTNVKFDVLKLDIIPRGRCAKWQVPFGSFSLAPSCLFPFLPRLGHTRDRDVLRPEDGFGQVRLSVYRGISQAMVKPPNIWWAGDSPSLFEVVAADVLKQISNKVLPFFSRFDDPEELLRTFLEDDDAIGREGIWEFGKMASATRHLYTGFAAIECGKWEVAISNLQTCRERIMAIPELVRPQVQEELWPYVEEGFACAARKLRWLATQNPAPTAR
jgi:hypothetical protein